MHSFRVCLLLAGVAACSRDRTSVGPAMGVTATTERDAAVHEAAATTDSGAVEGDAAFADDPLVLHHETTEELLQLLGADSAFLRGSFGPGAARMNQGNKALAHHAIGARACRDNLRGLVLQTAEQRQACGGSENMVPIYRGGHADKAKSCIDIFEFQNKTCELPIVWSSPSQAEKVCQSVGKRLCTQEEWTMGCAADPEGGKDRMYAYGNDLDLDICNTNKPHAFGPDGKNWSCFVKTAQTAWETCSTDTEPSGAYPRCRSRFGVFDQHGNVAEIMTRRASEGVVSQLKGSAFFYVDVARRHDQPPPKDAIRETYPDHCSYDARWHIEPIETATHVNYHLGFRCCKSI